MTTLKELCMSSISHLDSNGWVSLFTTLQDSNLDLEELKLSGNSIDDNGMQLLMRLVSNMSSLKQLNLSSNSSVTPTSWQALTGFLRSPNFALRELYLSQNYIDDDTLIALTSALAQNNTLTIISLGGTWDEDSSDEDDNESITERGWQAAASNLLCNKTSILETYNSNTTHFAYLVVILLIVLGILLHNQH